MDFVKGCGLGLWVEEERSHSFEYQLINRRNVRPEWEEAVWQLFAKITVFSGLGETMSGFMEGDNRHQATLFPQTVGIPERAIISTK